jgi:hypothetical protein
MKNLRKLAILLLDDENGINKDAYRELAKELIAEGHTDIVNAVTAQNGRYYLGEDDAADLAAVNSQSDIGNHVTTVIPENNYIPHETPFGEQIDGGGEID